ncbi:MAG: right-handed parallel beta-helix repeat-containing protein [Pirellulales bacterium]
MAARMRPERLEPRALLAVTVPPSIDGPFVEIDDNVVVGTGGGTIEGTSSYVQIFGNSKGRIDRDTGATNADLVLKAQTSITVTGAIGAVLPFDSLTLQSVGGQTVNLQQSVTLQEDLTVVKAGSFAIGSTVDVGGNLTITDATTVLFAGNVTVDGNLTITNATNVTFAGTLTVGGMLTITNATGTTRFAGDVKVAGAAVTSTSLVQVLAGFTTDAGELATDADVTFTTNQINLTTATLQVAEGNNSATLTIRPRDTTSNLTIASPPGIPSGLNITDADIFAIQAGWKRVVFGNEIQGTGAVKIGSIGSQYGGFSQLLNTTTIAGGSISVVQPIDVTALADYLELLALGDGEGAGAGITIDAPINQTADERNGWVRLTSAGPIAIKAPLWATETVSLTTTEGGTISQSGTAAAITAANLAVVADGGVTLADSGNAVLVLAVKTTNDDVVFREDSGYSIGQITTIDEQRDIPETVTVTGIDAGTGTVRLVTISGATASSVGQARAIIAAGLGLEGAGTEWTLSLATNDIGTLAADTGSVSFQDIDDLTIGTVAAVAPQSALSGIAVSGTVAVTAATKLTITSAGDIVSQATAGTAVSLSGVSGGIETAGDISAAGGNVVFNQAVTLTGDVAIDMVDGETTGKATFVSPINGTTAGQESLTITGALDARGSIGGTTALESLSVSGDATLAASGTFRTTGDQTYSGKTTSTGTITMQAGSGSTVKFLGETTFGGLVTATGDTSAYNVVLTGSPVSITNAVTFANTGTVTLGDADTDSLTFAGGITSTAPTLTKIAGTIATTNANASFGTASLTADTVVSAGSGNVTFSSTLDGGFALAVNATGTTTFGNTVGATNALKSLTTDAGGTTAIDGGSVKTSGTQTYNDAVRLGAATTLTGTTITTKGTVVGGVVNVSGPHGLTVKGDAVFGDAAADTLTWLGALVVEGTTTINTSLVSAGPVQQYKGQVTLGTGAKLVGQLVQFDGSIVGGGNALEIEVPSLSGVAVFGDAAADGVAGLASLTVSGPATINAATISSTGLQTYGDSVQLNESTTLTASGVEFKAKVEGHQRELTIDAGAAGVTFGGDIGKAAFPIGELDVNSTGNVVINGEIHSSGPVTIESSAGSISGNANNAIRSKGLASFDDTITLKAATGIGAGTPIAVEAPLGVTAKVTTSGGISLRGIGDLVVPAAGLDAPGTISLAASGNINVPTGGTVKGGDVVTTKEIRWSVLSATDSGAGSLRQVLLDVSDVGDCNASGTDAVLLFDLVGPTSGAGTTVISLTSQLPDVSAAVTLDGTGAGLVLDGGRRVASGLVYGSSAAGSVLRGVTLRNFTGFGVQLVNAQNVLVDTIVVQSLNTSTSMGLFATGTLTGSRIIGSSFSGGLRGALLQSTRNLVFGELGRGNTLSNNLAAPTNRKFAGTGIRSEGDCTGTVVAGNTFTGNSYGFAFIGARNLALRNNTFTRNSIAGIYIEADSSGSTQTGNTFGTGSERNKTNLLRAKRSRFG